jgi:hypothetical protein
MPGPRLCSARDPKNPAMHNFLCGDTGAGYDVTALFMHRCTWYACPQDLGNQSGFRQCQVMYSCCREQIPGLEPAQEPALRVAGRSLDEGILVTIPNSIGRDGGVFASGIG